MANFHLDKSYIQRRSIAKSIRFEIILINIASMAQTQTMPAQVYIKQVYEGAAMRDRKAPLAGSGRAWREDEVSIDSDEWDGADQR